MDVNDLATLFIGTDPKQKCIIFDKDGDVVFQDRVEFILYRSDPKLKAVGNSKVISLSISDSVDKEDDGLETGTLMINTNYKEGVD